MPKNETLSDQGTLFEGTVESSAVWADPDAPIRTRVEFTDSLGFPDDETGSEEEAVTREPADEITLLTVEQAKVRRASGLLNAANSSHSESHQRFLNYASRQNLSPGRAKRKLEDSTAVSEEAVRQHYNNFINLLRSQGHPENELPSLAEIEEEFFDGPKARSKREALYQEYRNKYGHDSLPVT